MITRRLGPLALAMSLLLGGCGPAGHAPPADLARAAVEKSLATWAGGGKPGEIAGSDPPIQAIDSAWQNGQKLAGFEVLGPVSGATEPRFAVRLDLAPPAKPVETDYVVIGTGPVFVYRDEDYRRMLHMDNNPAPPKPKSRRR